MKIAHRRVKPCPCRRGQVRAIVVNSGKAGTQVLTCCQHTPAPLLLIGLCEQPLVVAEQCRQLTDAQDDAVQQRDEQEGVNNFTQNKHADNYACKVSKCLRRFSLEGVFYALFTCTSENKLFTSNVVITQKAAIFSSIYL